METAKSRNLGGLAMTREGGLIRPHTTKLAFIYRLSDAVLIVLGLVISSRLYDTAWHDRYSFAAVVAVAAFYVFAALNGLYRSWRIASIMQEVSRLWIAWSGTLLTLLFIAFVLKTSEEYSRQVLVTWFLVTPAVISVWRVLWRATWREVRRRGHNSRSVAILGLTDLGSRLAKNIHEATWMGLRLAGYYDDRVPADGRVRNNCEQSTLLGDTETLIKQAQNGEIDMIYITLPLRAETRVNDLIKRLSDTTASVYFVPDLNAFDLLHARWYSLGEIPVVSIHETPFYGIDGWVKRAEDLVIGSLIMTLIAIPMLFIALGVKLTSRGPVIFKQKRYGGDGKEIMVWKFRTMTVCEDGENVVQAKKNDSRITPFGGFLRRTSLDELPQFINVLQGTMSIVGPRPHAIAHNEEYRKLIHRYMLRHKVKPGITGWAQVNGWRGETDTLDKMEKRVEYDLDYIRHWSLGLDLKIILGTVFYGFVGKNAY